MADKKTLNERVYQILVKPIVTEKSSMQGESNAITFEVAKDATKPEIKKAVETLYSVKVNKVNTLIQKGKTRRFKGIMGRRNDVKKAVVYLAEGNSVDISTGV